MIKKEILLIIIGFGALQSYLIGVYFLLKSHPKTRPSSLYIGLLFFAIGVRVSKSIYYLFLNGESIFLYNIGFMVHSMIGPLLLLYFKNHGRNFPQYKTDILHFIPSFALLFGSPFLDLSSFWYVGGYSFLLVYSLVYLLASMFWLYRNISSLGKSEKRWFLSLFIGVFLFLATYFTNYVMGWNSYSLGPMLYGIIVYIISFFVLTNQDFFKKSTKEANEKYKNLNLTEEQCTSYKEKIEKVIIQTKPHLNADFSLSQLSELTLIPPHILSYVFNKTFKLKFTDYINSRRIIEAKAKLVDKKYAHLKISSIAHDSGFNSLSVFNSTFKKFAGYTPSQYRSKVPTN